MFLKAQRPCPSDFVIFTSSQSTLAPPICSHRNRSPTSWLFTGGMTACLVLSAFPFDLLFKKRKDKCFAFSSLKGKAFVFTTFTAFMVFLPCGSCLMGYNHLSEAFPLSGGLPQSLPFKISLLLL